MATTIRWGILGTGAIAKKFAEGLKSVPDAALVAVGSRAKVTAEAFGEKYGVAHRHAAYEALAADPEVDAIYVATPHPLHHPNTILCLEHGKAVLCEKPFTINAGQTRELVARARQKKLFLLEAMWTRFLPLYVRVRRIVAEGTIGEVRMVQADFGFRADVNEEGRLFNRELGGGGLLDVGVYPVSFASMFFHDAPDRIASLAHIGSTGVDEEAGMVLTYGAGRMAVLACAIRTTTPHGAVIMGTKGRITVPPAFWHGDRMTLSVNGKPDEEISVPYPGNGYTCEAIEVGERLRAGDLESPIMPLDESIRVMETLDRIRAQWGLKYPGE